MLIDDATHRATESAIASTPMGEQLLRGRSEPIIAWRATGVIAMRGGGGKVDRLEPPFVGRDSELRLLKDLLHAVDDESRARLVSVTGIAGIGKSRLAWELEKYVDGIVSDVYWHQGRSPAYGEGIAFWALAEMVRSRAGIAEGEDAEATQAKLLTALAEYVPDEVERRTMDPLAARPVRAPGGARGPDRGSLRRRGGVHRADRRAGSRGLRVRGPPVGRRRASSTSSSRSSSGAATTGS